MAVLVLVLVWVVSPMEFLSKSDIRRSTASLLESFNLMLASVVICRSGSMFSVSDYIAGIASLGAYGGGLGLAGYGGGLGGYGGGLGGYGGGIVGIPVVTGGNLILGGGLGGLGGLGGGLGGGIGGLGGLGGNLGLGGYTLRGGLLRREDRALDDAGAEVSDTDSGSDNQQETNTI